MSMALELAKLGKEICMLSDAILHNMVLDQFIILAFAFGSLSLSKSKSLAHVPNFGGCQGRRTGVRVTTVSNSLILGGRVTKMLKNGDEK